MGRKEIDPETANEIKKELDELRKILETQKKAVKTVGQKKSKASCGIKRGRRLYAWDGQG